MGATGRFKGTDSEPSLIKHWPKKTGFFKEQNGISQVHHY